MDKNEREWKKNQIELEFQSEIYTSITSSYFTLFTKSLSTRAFAIINPRYLETSQDLSMPFRSQTDNM